MKIRIYTYDGGLTSLFFIKSMKWYEIVDFYDDKFDHGNIDEKIKKDTRII